MENKQPVRDAALPQTDRDEPEQRAAGTEPYVPRPRWQIWGARVALVLFLLLVAASYWLIARGGR